MTVPDAVEPEVVEFGGATTAVIRAVVPMDELAAFFDTVVLAPRRRPSPSRASPSRGRRSRCTTALPPTWPTWRSASRPTGRSSPPATWRPARSRPGRVARLVHLGGYDKLVSSWQRLASWMGEQGLTPGPLQWEVYVTEPSPDMDPADLRSELNWLLGD